MKILVISLKAFLCLILIHSAASLTHNRVARSSPAGHGSFTEPQGGLISVVTSHGAVQSEDVEEQYDTETMDEFSEDDLEMMRADQNGNNFDDEEEEDEDVDDDDDEDSLDRRAAHREKRFLTNKQSRLWPKAIVPYNFNTEALDEAGQFEVLVTQQLWHKYTCVRFVPWVLGETKEQYGLSDEGHVRFSKGSGCTSSQGNYHNKHGQWNSCCKRGTCIHEIGHTMGLWHEHQNPLRRDFLRLEWNRINPDKVWTFRALHPNNKVLLWQYDMSSTMHYPYSFHVLYRELSPLVKMRNDYYLFKDVSLSHDCKGLYCSDFPQECDNDGFLTLVDGVCSCLCPSGLDPDTGCTTTIREVTTSPVWPAGAYSVFSPVDGCPGSGVFETGTWQHWENGDNKQSSQVHLAGNFTPEWFQYQFCVKSPGNDHVEARDWETGRYCILRVGGECPAGFQTGYIQFDDSQDTPGTGSGQLPDGDFGFDTRLEFCCRDDGFFKTPLINLPNTHPFVLFTHKVNKECQEVAGMKYSKEFIEFDSFSQAEFAGEYPYGPSKSSLRIYYCYYMPAQMDCGGEIILSRANREAVITSPNFPNPYGTNIECNWLIKTEKEDDRVLLNFEEFEVTSEDGHCLDSLEIRFNILGQPGLRYCGDGLDRTIRSLNNSVMLTLRTDHNQVSSDYGFSLTASLYSLEEDGCYDPATKGRLYRGQWNYTRGMVPCVPWNQATHCSHHAYKSSDSAEGLEENYCRNPDNTAMPWCYTDTTCGRDYCDVCNIERVFNTEPLCKPEKVCSLPEAEILKLGCAGICGLLPPAAPIRGQICGAPANLPDADLKETAKETYNQGETIMYQCRTGAETATSTCLSDGQWSPVGYVCGGCSPGWAQYEGSCYKLFANQTMVNFFTARDTCHSHGSVLASVHSQGEMDFVSKLRYQEWSMWIGVTDIAEEGKFVWDDGTPLDWSNWKKGEPNNKNNGDCVIALANYRRTEWEDRNCEKHPEVFFVCEYTPSERTTCIDRVNCTRLLESDPQLCSLQPAFAEQTCPYSCGVCDVDSTPECPITPPSPGVELVSPTNKTSLSRGASVQFSCTEGYLLTQGQLTLACGDNGQLIGQLPLCQDPDDIIQESNDVEIKTRSRTTYSRYTYMGVGTKLTIQRNGVIKQWKYYSTVEKGISFFQVWRPEPSVGSHSYRIVGQNEVITRGQGQETYDVPETDWIQVQPGDRLALWENGMIMKRGMVPDSNCASGERSADYGVIRSPASKYNIFSTVVANNFSRSVYCRVFSYKAVIYPLDTVPSDHDMATNQNSLVPLYYLGAKKRVYLGEGTDYRIPMDGLVSQWQFYVRHPGSAALQVWRPRPDLGSNSFEFVGQNMFTITSSTADLYNMTVPEGERIAVKSGDITGIWYAPQRLGVRFNYCSPSTYPEGIDVHKSRGLDAGSLTVSDVINIPLDRSCQYFAYRAIVTRP